MNKNKLSFQQKRMLIRALDNDGGNYGYAPCGQGFARTMRSLVAAELAIATGTVFAIRGIVLTPAGRELAKQIKAELEATEVSNTLAFIEKALAKV
jgi:hypothetical protein